MPHLPPTSTSVLIRMHVHYDLLTILPFRMSHEHGPVLRLEPGCNPASTLVCCGRDGGLRLRSLAISHGGRGGGGLEDDGFIANIFVLSVHS